MRLWIASATRNVRSTRVSTRNADETWAKDRISGESQFMIPASRLSQVQKASKLIGTSGEEPAG